MLSSFRAGYPARKDETEKRSSRCKMTKNYSQLTFEQRYQIEALKNGGHNQSDVAKIVGVHKSTISREYKRNIPKRGVGAKVYEAEKAQKKTQTRHSEKEKHISFSLYLKLDCVKNDDRK